jgi:hypothetical protein
MHGRVDHYSPGWPSTSHSVDRPQYKDPEHIEHPKFYLVSKVSQLTVRTPGADRPPFILAAPPKPSKFLDNLLDSWRTVHPLGRTVRLFTISDIRDWLIKSVQPWRQALNQSVGLGQVVYYSLPLGRLSIIQSSAPTRNTKFSGWFSSTVAKRPPLKAGLSKSTCQH